MKKPATRTPKLSVVRSPNEDSESRRAEALERFEAAVRRHVSQGQVVGGFAGAVLANDLRGAVLAADEDSLAALPDAVLWVHHHVPMPAWGSGLAVETWRARFGVCYCPLCGKPREAAVDSLCAHCADWESGS